MRYIGRAFFDQMLISIDQNQHCFDHRQRLPFETPRVDAAGAGLAKASNPQKKCPGKYRGIPKIYDKAFTSSPPSFG